MITVISGTNRKNSKTKHVADHIFHLIKKESKEETQLLNLEDLPEDFVHNSMYSEKDQNKSLRKLQDKYFTPADRLVFVVPEYNGSYPGIFKLFIDAISVRNYKANFMGKKVLLIGVASGRAGNLRGLDHLTTSLNYLKMNIFPNRFPIANIEAVLNKKGKIRDKDLQDEIRSLAKSFLKF